MTSTTNQLGAKMLTDEQITAACTAYTRASGTLREVMRDVLASALTPAPLSASTPAAPEGFALVPLILTREMDEVLSDEGWQWEDLLAAAEAITPEQYNQIAASPAAPTAQAAVPHWHASNAEPPKFEITTAAPQDERAAFDDQKIYDEFSFLEGAVNEPTYRQIARTAIELVRAALAAAPAQSGDAVAEVKEVYNSEIPGELCVELHPGVKLPKGTLLYAAPQPAQPVEGGEACEHDYVRSDRVCTECGEKSAVVLDGERAAFKELRSQMAYIAAYDLNELDGMSKDRLAGRLRSVIDRARKATATQAAKTTLDETGVIERLSHHIADKRNTAFSRSTMQDAMTLIGELTLPAQTERALTDEDRQAAVEAWEKRIIAAGRNISSREAACFEDGFEACRALLTAAQPASGDSK